MNPAEDGASALADPVRLPEPGLLFGARAGRFRALAAGHAAPEWLLLLARVADGQRAAVREIRVHPAPALGDGPPIAHAERDGSWRRMLAVVLSGARAPGLPAETLDALRFLSEGGADDLEEIADLVLAGEVPEDRLACAPFVGAALQAWLGALAAQVDPAGAPSGGLECPVCGAPPVAGIVQASDRARWLACSLCGAEWRLERLRCAACGSDARLGYFHVEGDPGATAEACGGCRAYLKLFDEEKRPGAVPAADDAATIALDLLMADEGYQRAGANPYLAHLVPFARHGRQQPSQP